MPSPHHRPAAAALLFAVALALTACATPEVTEPRASPAPTAGSADTAPATPAPEPAETAEPVVDPTCTTIIAATTVADFEELGWTHREEPFRIGEMDVPDGIQCSWADFAVPGGPAQIFGWAPIEDALAKDAQTELLAADWLRENGDEGVYVTENPEMALTTDAEGYGMTYLFGDGWVTLADTKQSLLLIERPQG
ncbi:MULTISPECIES: hypothetical protein [unclassified Microbacterium]|uniref:hypothetical protein n=1 Tax=unclassified Microbacterium TaxID=2609290 RepID=UPI00214C5690|nr:MULTISPECIES: hypothetical protein [unclassified Microbacterium]MCR2784566.1 hypothetical protein [Microbacterium sp. zg.B96]MDL5350515.1 hypothetical protein [Microbacterium sp. zg-YB36]WIM14625.1 hypothetical protein QNO11_08570 [Microbacterium sp. zg-B96]